MESGSFLYKPFTKSDISALLATLGISSAFAPGDGSSRGFLIVAGSARILSFPEEDDPALKVFANALGTEIPKELRDMAEEGVNRLVIKLTPAVAADFSIVKRFLALIELIETLTLSVRLVAGNEKTRGKLQKFSETARMQTFDSLELALKSFD